MSLSLPACYSNYEPKIAYHPNGAVKSIEYVSCCNYYREDGPAIQRWNQNGGLIEEVWCQYRVHRVGGPSTRVWNDAGILVSEDWWQGGYLHRDDGPTTRHWDAAGRLILEEWKLHGRFHRINGPAFFRVWNGAIVELWYHNGRQLTACEIEKILRPDDIMAALRALPQPIAEEVIAEYRAV